MDRRANPYGFGTTIDLPHAEALRLTRESLVAEGFGVLCEIDLAATLHAKLGVHVEPYVILGACNPPLAHRALEVEREVGLLLPCNVVVYATDTPDRCVVAMLDPERALTLAGNDDLRPVAAEAAARLRRALLAVERSGAAARRPVPAAQSEEIVEEIC